MSEEEFVSAARLSRARLLAGAGAMALGGTLAAELAGLRQPVAFARELAGATVVEASLADPTTFNPLVGQDFAAYVVASLCFEGLMTIDTKGNAVPALAESVAVKKAANQYIFKLRKGLKWSDGQPLTADDVAFTYNLMFSPKYVDFSSAYRGDATQHIKSVNAIDKQTVQITTRGVYAPFLVSFGTLGILPRHTLVGMSAKDLNTASYNQGPTVTNGVFKFASRQNGASITLARNPNYWRGPAKLAGYVIKIVPTSVSIAQQVATGEVDIGPVTADQFQTIKSSSAATLITFPSQNVEVATFNMNPTSQAAPIFVDKRVRQALWWGLDRRAIIQAAFFGSGGVFTNSVEPVGTWAYSKKITPNYTFDAAKANSLLDAAGWAKGSSGVREKNGKQMAWTIQTTRSYIVAAQAMAQQWKAVGADVSTQQVTIGVIIDQLFHTRSFDMIFIADNLLSADPDLSAYYHSRNTIPGGLNSGNYKNPKMDAALDAANRVLNRDKRAKLYQTFQNVFADDPPAIPMVDLVQAYGVSKKVSGAVFNTYNNFTPRPFLAAMTKK
jgi:peptide/nickel transport system substrate-binding protein